MKYLRPVRCSYCKHANFHDFDTFTRHKRRHVVFHGWNSSWRRKQRHWIANLQGAPSSSKIRMDLIRVKIPAVRGRPLLPVVKKRKVTGKMRCPSCAVVADDESSLRIHISMAHYCWYCTMCVVDVKAHVNDHHRCMVCQNVFTISQLALHTTSEHTCGLTGCKKKIQRNITHHNVVDHQASFPQPMGHTCMICKMVFPSKCSRKLALYEVARCQSYPQTVLMQVKRQMQN